MIRIENHTFNSYRSIGPVAGTETQTGDRYKLTSNKMNALLASARTLEDRRYRHEEASQLKEKHREHYCWNLAGHYGMAAKTHTFADMRQSMAKHEK